MVKKNQIKLISKKIGEVDGKILELMKKRVELTRKIGKRVLDKEVSAADKKYEEIIAKSRSAAAKALDMEVNFVDTVFKGIINYSKSARAKLTKKEKASPKKKASKKKKRR